MNSRHKTRKVNEGKPHVFKDMQGIGLALCLIACGLSSYGCQRLSRGPVCLPGAQVSQDGQCISKQAPVHRMPFRAGFKARVTQGFHGYFSHKDDTSFALDFKCKRGEPIVASRAGVVWALKKGSDKGCANRSCGDDANYVVLDHGDGTYSEYYHLQHWGVLVNKGQSVCAGEVIGLCGNTGFSTSSHLHFSVTALTRQSVPVRFEEARRPGTGFMVPATTYTSTNVMEVNCGKQEYSMLESYAFAHLGIVLDQPLPMYVKQHQTKKMRISGAYYGAHKYVAINLKAVKSGKWSSQCVPVKDQRFDAIVDWKKVTRGQKGQYWFIVTGANKKCDGPGWAWSYKLDVQ